MKQYTLWGEEVSHDLDTQVAMAAIRNRPELLTTQEQGRNGILFWEAFKILVGDDRNEIACQNFCQHIEGIRRRFQEIRSDHQKRI